MDLWKKNQDKIIDINRNNLTYNRVYYNLIYEFRIKYYSFRLSLFYSKNNKISQIRFTCLDMITSCFLCHTELYYPQLFSNVDTNKKLLDYINDLKPIALYHKKDKVICETNYNYFL